MSNLTIRHASEADLPEIMRIYSAARKFMAAHGNPNQWGSSWPPEDLIRQGILERKCYLCETPDHIAGTFFFDFGKDIEPTYQSIEDGSWIDDSPYGVVHRIASDGTQKGVGRTCLNWAFSQCHHLRIDTHPDNVVMQNLLAGLGFQKCGIIHVLQDNNPRLAYEKI